MEFRAIVSLHATRVASGVDSLDVSGSANLWLFSHTQRHLDFSNLDLMILSNREQSGCHAPTGVYCDKFCRAVPIPL